MIIVGLGNPGTEYKNTRHNTGRLVLDIFRQKNDLPDWKENRKLKSLVSAGKIGKTKISLLLPGIFMNKSGEAISKLIKSKKGAENLEPTSPDLFIKVSGKSKEIFV